MRDGRILSVSLLGTCAHDLILLAQKQSLVAIHLGRILSVDGPREEPDLGRCGSTGAGGRLHPVRKGRG